MAGLGNGLKVLNLQNRVKQAIRFLQNYLRVERQRMSWMFQVHQENGKIT